MDRWTQSPEAALLLASCAAFPPRRRFFAFRFQESQERYVGQRVRRLRRLYLAGEPERDTQAWRTWLTLDPERAIREAIRRRADCATLHCPKEPQRWSTRPEIPLPATIA